MAFPIFDRRDGQIRNSTDYPGRKAMSVSILTFGTSCTITVGSLDTFSNDAATDISPQVNKLIGEVPAGDRTVINLDPGTYGVGTPILLSSNTSVVGDDATLEYLPGKDSQTNWGLLSNGYPSTQSVSISVQGVTCIISNAHIFGTWFTNAKDIDVQDNTYIGGTDGNAFVSVIDAIASNNVAIAQTNAAYDNWNGPVNTVIENNIGYVYGADPGYDVLMNASTANLNYAGAGAAYGIPAGDAVNDGIVDNALSTNFPGALSVEATALLPYGYTTESEITQQGNVTEGLGFFNSGLDLDGSPQSNATIEDDSFVGIIYNTTQGYAVIESVGQNVPGYQTSNTEMNGNLILGFSTENSVPPIIDHGSDVSSVNNASIGESNRYVGAISTYGYGTPITSSGNITNIGTYVAGSGVTPAIDITAPPEINAQIDSATSIPDMSIDDTKDSSTISVTLRTTFGTLSLPEGVLDASYTTILGESADILTGSLAEVNAELAALSYTSNVAGWDDAIEINVSDADGFTSTRYVPVNVGNTESSNDQVTTITPGEVLPELYYTTIAPPSSLSNDTVIGSSGGNLINMGSTISIVFLQTGLDTVIGGSGAGYIATGSGQAEISLTGDGNVSIAGGSGPMTINAAVGDNVIDSGASNALVKGGSGSNTVAGGLGNLTVLGGSGAMYIATLPQDGGNLTANLGTGNTTLFALSGNDYITTKSHTANFIDLGIGNDCVASAGADIILAGAGNDTIDASSGGSDTVDRGSGSLYFIAGAGNSFVQEGSRPNTVEGGTGNLTVQGAAGAMYIATLPQGGGNLTAELGWTNETVFALSGNDYIASRANTDNFIDLGIGNDFVASAGGDTIQTGAGNDTIDAISGGSDSISGGSGSLYFIAGTGDSVVDPASQSTILAGAGNLTIGGSSETTDLQIDQIIGTSRVITVDYRSTEIPLIGYGEDPIVGQNLGGEFLNVTLSDGTRLKLYDPQSQDATVLSGTLSLIPWWNLKNPDVINIDNLLGSTASSGELNTPLLESAASQVASGKTAVLYAALPPSAVLVNNGTVVLDPTYLTLENPLIGTGVLEIDTGSGLAVEGSVASTQTISFTGTEGSLIIGDVGQFLGTVSGFLGDNTIDLSNVYFSESGFATLTSGNSLDVIENGETAAIQLDANESYAGHVFDLSNDGLGGTSIIDATNFTVPFGEATLFADAPMSEEIIGNGSDNFSATLGSASNVSFISNGGSGTVVVKGAGDFVDATGTTWSIVGNAAGNSTVDSSATAGTEVQVYGQGNAENNAIGADTIPSNVVGLAGNATVLSYGTNDLIETFSGNDVITVYNSANVLINGGADTVYAAAGSTAVNAFFNLAGGQLYFINNSTTSATVSGDVPGASGGNVTAFGGAGGGVFIGGFAGNNSLIGGAGTVDLVAAGTNNFLSVSGYGNAYSNQNILVGGAGGATMVAASTTGFNEFYGGGGTDSIVSFGSGNQTYYVGTVGLEILTGSTTNGATNEYIFNQTPAQGGDDIITNFRLGTDHIDINFDASVNGVVTIQSYQSLGGGHSGTMIYLSDNTTIQLYGVSKSSLNASIIGGTHI